MPYAMEEVVVQQVLMSGYDTRGARHAELFLGAFDPPAELYPWAGDELGCFGGANVGRCEKSVGADLGG